MNEPGIRGSAMGAALSRNRRKIASRWARDAEGLLARHHRELSADEVRRTCDRGVSTIVEWVETGSAAPLDAFLDALTTRRLALHFEIDELIEELLLLEEVAAPYVLADARTSPTTNGDTLRSLEETMRGVAGRLCRLFAARRHEQLRELAVDEERHRLARELHDSLTQSIYSVGLLGEAAARQLEKGHVEEAKSLLREISATAHGALAEMRIRLFELQPPVLLQDDLGSALRARLASVEQRSGLTVTCRVKGERRPPLTVERELLAVAHELLNNSLKHAQARRVDLFLNQESDGVWLEIADDGIGFDLTRARLAGGRGLTGIEERTRRIHGSVEIETFPGQGTRARIRVPLRPVPS